MLKTSKRLKQTKPIIAPRTMKLLQDRLDDLNMNPHELANKMDAAYDHIRLIVKGEKFAGKLMIKEIGRHLNISEDALMLAYREDKAEKAGHKIPPVEPRLQELTELYNRVPEDIKEQIVKFAKFQASTDARAVHQ
jgi:hypothetical protein